MDESKEQGTLMHSLGLTNDFIPGACTLAS
jgi:hypothetical protein